MHRSSLAVLRGLKYLDLIEDRLGTVGRSSLALLRGLKHADRRGGLPGDSVSEWPRAAPWIEITRRTT